MKKKLNNYDPLVNALVIRGWKINPIMVIVVGVRGISYELVKNIPSLTTKIQRKLIHPTNINKIQNLIA